MKNINPLPFFRFRKYAHVLKTSYHLYERKKNSFPEETKNTILYHLKSLQEAISTKNSSVAKEEAAQVEKLTIQFLQKTPFEKIRSLVIALAVALCLAILIRQLSFEFYEIPTGSMRPTLKEKDRLFVTKTSFGINLPLSLDHLYFSPDLVKRSGIVVFSGEGMDIPNVDTLYFYIFPGKKQYIKRMIGKPGDILYFHGGLLYGIDKCDNDISKELQLTRLDQIEHVPFLQFEGKISTPSSPVNGVYTPVILKQMNEPIAKLSVSGLNQVTGELLSSANNPSKNPHTIKTYSDLWGIKNFGMARILNKREALQFTNETIATLPLSSYYMEIKHHPSLLNLKIKQDGRGRMRPMLDISTSVIPLTENHLRKLFENLYTVRFTVENGVAYQYGLAPAPLHSPFLPKFPDVPNGTYEFYYGKAYKIGFQGIATELSKDHPLYRFDAEKAQMFYNLGMEFDTRFSPQSKYSPLYPLRYVYFREGDLYVMGSPLFSKEDPLLIQFNEKEKARQALAPPQYPYVPFESSKAPIKDDGSLDIEFIKNYGLTVPEKMYLVLGDNHAVSADSREFGFVPEENLKGAPDLIFWPPGHRFGHPNQPPYPFFNLPRSIIWIVIGLSIGATLLFQRRRNKIPLL